MASGAPALHPVAQLAAAAAPPQLVASYRPGPPVGADLLARSGPRVLSSAGTSASSGAGMASGADRSSGSDGGGAYARPREVSTREPGDDSAALPTGAATAAPPEASTVDLSTLHVLLVDDERLSRMVAANLLKKCGYKVTALDSAAGAMEALEADPSAYSMVLTDMMMPPPDGIDLLTYVRASPELAHVPVVMMSSNEHRGTVLECLRHGVDDFIVKPVTLKELAHVWTHAWRRRTGLAPGGAVDAVDWQRSRPATPSRSTGEEGAGAADRAGSSEYGAGGPLTPTAGGYACPVAGLREYCERESALHAAVSSALARVSADTITGDELAAIIGQSGALLESPETAMDDAGAAESETLHEAMQKLGIGQQQAPGRGGGHRQH